ncbi:hypothetical protein Zmor_021411 [Zophobas morio]|uniref:Uncharacterized protein n=1 Tax=Zophobas morio TaxID=2755281 RepID=A0AA38I6D0_9CUCU|nr:hypothetical protein Zmor_021411 [Zophobas morio]
MKYCTNLEKYCTIFKNCSKRLLSAAVHASLFGFISGDCTGQWGGANFPFQHCGKILVQINNIYANCMAGDLVLDVKDLLQMPHPSSPRKYLLS